MATLASSALLAAAPVASAAAAQAPSPRPAPSFTVGEPIPDNRGKLPFCGIGAGNTYVLLSQKRAIVVGGTGRYVQDILTPGQSYNDDAGVRLRYNMDGKSISYTREGASKPVKTVCKPLR
ncbi:hypothetical protein ACFV2N_22545 [Streptomyces sp. NPDC059680]|uniref:hypothetical protein n=1 Tax=Streptomyces sp. NPDC059680 TaxID=3346904 RepID=UPI0036B06E01